MSSRLLERASLGVSWLLLSASVVVTNKYILSRTHFKYAVGLAFVHMLAATGMCRLLFLCYPAAKSSMDDRLHFDEHMQGRFCVIAGLFSLSLVSSNAALQKLDIATVQMVKAINPACIYAVGVFWKLEKASNRLVACLAVICGGLALAVCTVPNFHAVGICLQLLAILADTSRYVYLQATLQSRGVAIDSINLLSVVAPITGVFLWSGGAIYEFPDIRIGLESFLSIIPIVIASSLLAFALNVSSYAYIQATSALTMSVSGIFKDVAMVVFSVAFLGNSLGSTQWIGYAIAVCGTLIYVKMRELPD
jgi:drug/metabolite transporter (DMT)-like permease